MIVGQMDVSVDRSIGAVYPDKPSVINFGRGQCNWSLNQTGVKGPLGRPSVCIVENSVLITENLMDRFALSSWEIKQTFSRGERFCRWMTEQNPGLDLVLLDWELDGELTGPECCRRIKDESGDSTVILHSSKSTDKLKEATRQCGADGWLKKCSPDETYERLKEFSDPNTQVDLDIGDYTGLEING